MKPYYEDDLVTIYHGDCLELLPELAFDVVVTDPPYGVKFGGKSTKHGKSKGGYASHVDDADFVTDVVAPLVRQLVGRARVVCLTPGLRNMFSYPVPDHVGTLFYPSGAGQSSWGFTCSQPVFYYGKDPYLAAGKGSRPDSIWTTDNANEVTGHPCPKPLSVMRWMVGRVSIDPADLILDPFMGSGTTLRAAKDLGRKAIGIEIDEAYCEIAAKRMGQGVLDFG